MRNKKVNLEEASGGRFAQMVESGAEKVSDAIHMGWSKVLGDKALDKIWDGVEKVYVQAEKRLANFFKARTK